ncbi:MAG: ABC transporter transmembrane domain-containing protein, partial [Acidimicrobiales bacterium]
MGVATWRPKHVKGSTTFVPEPDAEVYSAPRAGIDPDRSKSWLKRATPILRSHQRIFLTALVLSFFGLVLQVQIPNLLRNAIDNSIVRHAVPLNFYVWWVVGLAVVGLVAGYISRLFLFQTAYNIEFDLRNIIYEHLTQMSFP